MHTTQERPGVALGAKTSERLLRQQLGVVAVTEAGRRALADLQDGGCVGCDSSICGTDGSILPTRLYRVIHRDGRSESPVRYCAGCVEVVATAREMDTIASVQLVHPAPGDVNSTLAVYTSVGFDDVGKLHYCEAAEFGYVRLANVLQAGVRLGGYDRAIVVMRDDEVVWAGRLVRGVALAAQYMEIAPPIIGEFAGDVEDFTPMGGDDHAS